MKRLIIGTILAGLSLMMIIASVILGTATFQGNNGFAMIFILSSIMAIFGWRAMQRARGKKNG